MAADYTYYATDLRRGTVLDEIRLTGQVSMECSLNGRGALGADVPRYAATSTRNILAENATGIVAVRNGQPLWAGYVSQVQADEGNALKIAALGHLGYLSRRRLREDRRYVQVDQATILADLVRYTMGLAATTYGATRGPGGGIPLAISAPLSGVLRDRTYLGLDRPWVGDLLDALSQVEGGPDFGVVTTIASDVQAFTHTFTTWAARGSSSPVRLDYPGNISRYTVSYDGDTQANRVEAMNDADSADRLIVSAFGADPLAWDTVVSRPGVIALETLTAAARQTLATYATPLKTVSVSLNNPDSPSVGDLREGDQVRVAIMDGYVNVDQVLRVVAWRVTLGAGGSEVLDLTLVDPALMGVPVLA